MSDICTCFYYGLQSEPCTHGLVLNLAKVQPKRHIQDDLELAGPAKQAKLPPAADMTKHVSYSAALVSIHLTAAAAAAANVTADDQLFLGFPDEALTALASKFTFAASEVPAGLHTVADALIAASAAANEKLDEQTMQDPNISAAIREFAASSSFLAMALAKIKTKESILIRAVFKYFTYNFLNF